MQNCFQKRQPNFRVFTGWLALVLYLVALSPAGAALTALVALASPEHELQVGCSESGVAVVLHHTGNCSMHHHSRAGRLLTLLALENNSTSPDHVIQFTSLTVATRDARVDAHNPTAADGLWSAVQSASLIVFPTVVSSLAVPPPPPDAGGRGFCLGATVLLI
jgi:hypothetical protein